jgi:hypothetical protein
MAKARASTQLHNICKRMLEIFKAAPTLALAIVSSAISRY